MPGSVFAFLNGFGQQGWADMSIMNIEVLAGGKRYRFQSEAGTSLKDCLLKAGILEGAECGGRGICGKCAVKVRSGTLAPVEGDESFLMTRGDGKVLACQSLIREDVVIEISAGRDDVRRKVRLPNLQKEKKYSDSLIEKKFIQLSKPSLRDQASDLERILAQVGKNKKVAFSLLGGLPEIVRKADFEVTAVLVEDELIAVEPGDTHALRYGFILDIGTTTIAVYLVDLLSGEVLDADGTANPQRVFGADVLSRITAAAGRENLEKMQAVTIKGISETMRGLLRSLSIDENHVYSVVAVGNTTMSHLFLGVDPKNLRVVSVMPCTCKKAEAALPTMKWSGAAGWGCPCIRKGPCMSSRTSPVMWAPIPLASPWPRSCGNRRATPLPWTSERTAKSFWATRVGCWPVPQRRGPLSRVRISRTA
mgnify:CR=1 FL=1